MSEKSQNWEGISANTRAIIEAESELGTHNYHPLPVVLARGEREYVWDIDGKRYLDLLSAYSALNQGHNHPRMYQVLLEQGKTLTLTSRAFHQNKMLDWLKITTQITGKDRVIPMNSGAEAVETAIKLMRKWAYTKKKIPENQAEIVVCANNFHGRTTTVVSFSTEEQYYKDFGPLTGGFVVVPFGDINAMKKAIGPKTAGVLLEPIQGEAGVIVPPVGYLEQVSALCKSQGCLLAVDEIQTGLCRTGKWFAFQHEKCEPDLIILGKALGGGYYPVSLVAGQHEVMEVFKPGDHGSTFGGNPLACALSLEAIRILQDENAAERAEKLGAQFKAGLEALPKHIVKEVRGKGLLLAFELQPGAGKGRFFTTKLMQMGVLAKETHDLTIRFAPPLVISEESIQEALKIISHVFSKTQQQWLNG
jgi:ornithine--oxo-acid transaminase